MSELVRAIHFEPGFDCVRFECRHGMVSCAPGKGGSHGLHGLEIRWVLSSEAGAVQFLLCASDMVPEPELYGDKVRKFGMLPMDLGYHSPVPRYEDHSSMGPCPHIGGRECYYGGSGLNAHDAYRVLCNEGGDGLWAWLELYHAHTFGEGVPYPEVKPYRYKRRAKP